MADGKCVHPQGGAEDPDDNTFLTLVDCDPYNNKRIKFEGLGDNDYWNIVHLSSGMYIYCCKVRRLTTFKDWNVPQ